MAKCRHMAGQQSSWTRLCLHTHISVCGTAGTHGSQVMLMSGQLEKQSKLIVGSKNAGSRQLARSQQARRALSLPAWAGQLAAIAWLSSATRSLKTSCLTWMLNLLTTSPLSVPLSLPLSLASSSLPCYWGFSAKCSQAKPISYTL